MPSSILATYAHDACCRFQKLVHKTYNKMVPNEDDGENGKHKPPNLTRLMRSRLEKLVNKTDSQYVYFPKHLSLHTF